jgi:hypothetical protein
VCRVSSLQVFGPHKLASWLSFGTARRRGARSLARLTCTGIARIRSQFLHGSPAILSKALIRPCLVYPLASFDVSGQWLISHSAASPNEVLILHGYYTLVMHESQEEKIAFL